MNLYDCNQLFYSRSCVAKCVEMKFELLCMIYVYKFDRCYILMNNYNDVLAKY